MNLVPIEPAKGSKTAPLMRYSILKKSKKSPARVRIFIRADLVKKLKAKHGDVLRLDGDLAERAARLTPVLSSQAKATRKLVVDESGHGVWVIAHTGNVVAAFPLVESGTELTGVEVMSDGLMFALPPPRAAQ